MKAFPIIPLALAVALTAAVSPAPAQVRINGYFSFDVVRGPEGLDEKAWSAEGLRGGLVFGGEWAPGFYFALETALAPEGRVDPLEAWAGFAASPALSLKAGLFRVPFGRRNLARRPFETNLILDPTPVGVLFPLDWREIGLLAEGGFGNFRYAAFAGNGLAEAADLGGGQQFRDNNRNKGWGGRLGAALSDALEIGGSYYTARVDDAGERRIRILGADGFWGTENLRATGEYAKASIDNPAPFAGGEAEGGYVLLEAVFGRLTPLACYSRLRYEDPFHGPGFEAASVLPGAGLASEGKRWAFGAAYALHANILLKIEYDRRREAGEDRWTSGLRAQAAVHF